MRNASLALIVAAFTAAAGALAGHDDRIFVAEVLYYPDDTSPPAFIELYNAAPANVALKGWRIKAYTSRGYEQDTLPDDAIIPAHGFYLIGRKGDEASWGKYTFRPDFYSETLSFQFLRDRGGVILVKASGQTRDAAGWGGAPAPYYETTPHPPVGEGHSLERKSAFVHQEMQGNSYDTNNNADDLRERTTPEPQNILSPRETPSANTDDNAWGRIKAIYYGQR